MQAFDDLKSDIQTLIDTASGTIQSLVDQAARNAAAAVPSTSGIDTADVFTSQLADLSSKVRMATDSLRSQAAAVLANTPSSSQSDTGGSQEALGANDAAVGSIGPGSFKAPG